MILSPKWIALVALILQNSGLAILMRYTMVSTQVGTDRYLSSTAVLTAEVLKLSISVVLCFIVDCNMSYKMFISSLYSEFIGNRSDWIKLMVPSILYTLQNSLQYFSMSRLSAPVFQVLYQLKIVTTAIFSVTLLARRISALQWLSVVMLTGKTHWNRLICIKSRRSLGCWWCWDLIASKRMRLGVARRLCSTPRQTTDTHTDWVLKDGLFKQDHFVILSYADTAIILFSVTYEIVTIRRSRDGAVISEWRKQWGLKRRQFGRAHIRITG